jgi:DUF1680 family protein
LPNATAYNETCAAIGDVFWNQRMFLLHGDAKYIDLLEKVLYNGLLSGVGLDGKSFFYTNAMQVTDSFKHADLERERSGWFECSCCPTNMLRLLPSLPGYIYAQKGHDLYINLFIPDTARLVMDGKVLRVVQENDYPWKGNLSFTLLPEAPVSMGLKIRVPGWVRGEAIPGSLYTFEDKRVRGVVIRVNGVVTGYTMENGYAVLKRVWKKGDQVRMELPMQVQAVQASAKVPEDAGKVAIQRGPLMYCAEWKDNGGKVGGLEFARNADMAAKYRPDLLGGVMVLSGAGMTLIPYYAWANRGKGEMTVWVKEK